MRRLPVAVTIALLLAGCGSEGGPFGSPAADRAVAREVARGLLSTRETVQRPPTDAEIDDLVARGVKASCRHRERSDYDCRISVRGFAKYACAATVVNGVASNMRCGSGQTAPRVSASFVDCVGVGKVVSIADPPGDAGEPTVDLVSVAVAASGDKLCADFEFAQPPTPQTVISLIAAHVEPGPPPGEALDATLDLSQPTGAAVRDINRGALSATVGTRGDSVSLVIEKDALPPTLAYLFESPFKFEVHVGATGNSPGAPQDGVPNSGDWPVYG